jgi:hypothetical protein
MNDMKLIMEGWRNFVNEDRTETNTDISYEEQLDEGALSALSGLAVILSLGSGPAQEVPVDSVVDAYRSVSTEMGKTKSKVEWDSLAKTKMELGKLVDDIIKTGQNIDFDGDGQVDEIQPSQTPELSPHTVSSIQSAMSMGSSMTGHGYY